MRKRIKMAKSDKDEASIRSTVGTLKKLSKYKITDRETYEAVIKRLIKNNDDFKNKDDLRLGENNAE